MALALALTIAGILIAAAFPVLDFLLRRRKEIEHKKSERQSSWEMYSTKTSAAGCKMLSYHLPSTQYTLRTIACERLRHIPEINELAREISTQLNSYLDRNEAHLCYGLHVQTQFKSRKIPA